MSFKYCVFTIGLSIIHSFELYSSGLQYFNTHDPFFSLIGISLKHSFNITLII